MTKSILVIGLGRFGRHIIDEINVLGHDIMAVDTSEERVNAIMPYVTDAQIGDATNSLFLETLGVDNFDVCIVAIGDDFQNSLETTSLLKEMGAKQVVSRAESDVQEKFLLRNGADAVVYPQKAIASWAAIRYTADHITDYFELEDGYAVFEVSIPEEWYGKTLKELDIRKKYQLNIIAMKSEGKMLPSLDPDAVLDDNDAMLVLGQLKQIQKCFHI